MKILVIQKKLMGDVLVSSVVFESLKRYFPDAELHYLVEEKHAQIVLNHKKIDKIIYFNDFIPTLHKIKKERYDVVIDLYAKVETAILSWFSGAKKRISFHKKYTAPFYTDTIIRSDEVKFPNLTTALEHRLRLLTPLGIEIEEVIPKIYISEQEKNDASSLLQSFGIQGDMIMISTFGSIPEKTYPIEYMASVIDTVSKYSSANILCNYLPSQKEDFQRLYDMLSEAAKNKIIKEFDTKNLRQYIAVLSQCKALIGNEGGSTNISKALKVPTFSIYAPDIGGWDWCLDGVRNVSIHARDYQVNDYHCFKPELFQEKLIEFIQNNLR